MEKKIYCFILVIVGMMSMGCNPMVLQFNVTVQPLKASESPFPTTTPDPLSSYSPEPITTPIILNDEINWACRYSGINYMYSITPSVSNGWLVVGTFYSDTSDWTAVIAKIDSQGHNIWAEEFGGNKYDSLKNIITTQDGNYLAIGESNSLGDGNGDWLLKVDDNGNTLWEKYFNSLPGQPAVCETSDGELIVVSSGMYHELCIIRLNSSGEVLWQKAGSRDMGFVIGDVCASNDGGFVVAASTFWDSSKNMDYWVLKFDARGILQWQKTYGGPEREWISQIYRTNDGYVFGGDTFSFGSNGQDSLLIKINSLGNIIWQKKFDINQNYEGITTISSNKKGGLIAIISGTIINLQVDASLVSSRSYPAVIQKILNLPSFGFIAGGYSSDGFVMRLDDKVTCGSYGDDKAVTIHDVSVTVVDTNLYLSDENRQVLDVISHKATHVISDYTLYPIPLE